MVKKAQWGVLSTAKIAVEEVIPAITKAENAEIIAIASAKEKAVSLSEQFNIPTVYANYDELLNDDKVEYVYIPLPNALHLEWVKKAAKKGKNILCEKPATLTAKEADEMIQICRQENVLFMEAFMYQFHPQHQRVRHIIRSGEIGEVKEVRAGLSFMLEEQQGNIRMDPDMGGGSLYDLGCYCIHAIRTVLEEEPSSVFVHAPKNRGQKVDMSSYGILSFNKGKTATFNVAMDRTRTGHYEIIGTQGSIHVPRAFTPHMFNGEGHVLVYDDEGNHRQENIYGHPYIMEIEYFSSLMDKQTNKDDLMANTLQNMQVLDACQRSLRTHSYTLVSKTIEMTN